MTASPPSGRLLSDCHALAQGFAGNERRLLWRCET
jgi:hypothetical protein